MADELNYIDKIVRDKVANHAVESSLNNWAHIQRAAFWKNFFTFRIFSVNAYYAVAIVMIGIGSLSYFIEPASNVAQFNQNDQLVAETNPSVELNPNNEAANRNTPIAQIELTSKSPIIDSKAKDYQIDYKAELAKPNPSDIAKLSKIEIPSSTEPIALDRKTEIQNKNASLTDVVHPDEISETPSPKLEKEGHADAASLIASNVTEEKTGVLVDVESPTIVDEKLDSENQEEASLLPVDFISEENTIEEEETIEPSLEENLAPESPANLEDAFVLAEQASLIGDLNYMPLRSLVYSNSMAFDPAYRLLYSDTFDYYVPPAERYLWRLGVFYAPIYSTPQNYASNPEVVDVIRQKEKIEKPAMTFSTGVSLQYQGRKRIGFQTGVGVTQLGDLFSRGEYSDITPYSYPKYPEGGYNEIDTILFFNLDSLLQGVEYIDTIFDPQWVEDNTMIEGADTTKYKGAKVQNRFTYIEVPFLFSYNIPGPRLSYTLKLGMAAGFLIQADGKKLNTENEFEIVDFEYDSPKYRKVNYSVLAGVDFNYRFHQRFSFTTGFMYRRNLFDVYENYPYGLKYTSTQVTFGIQYYL
ncbi:MAG: PorT family protein [Bacteroidales bacterium]|nr:PorT family protein [Bacteroidales bacterium]MCF8455324.1 PorT family protein [Bacteroidales bacterium]